MYAATNLSLPAFAWETPVDSWSNPLDNAGKFADKTFNPLFTKTVPSATLLAPFVYSLIPFWSVPTPAAYSLNLLSNVPNPSDNSFEPFCNLFVASTNSFTIESKSELFSDLLSINEAALTTAVIEPSNEKFLTSAVTSM